MRDGGLRLKHDPKDGDTHGRILRMKCQKEEPGHSNSARELIMFTEGHSAPYLY